MLQSCSLLSSTPGEDATLLTPLAPTTAAWVIAETCRHAFPAADPQPRHAWAPAQSLGSGRFVVHYARRATQSYRLAHDSRLQPPLVIGEDGVFALPDAPHEAVRSRGVPWGAAEYAYFAIEPGQGWSRVLAETRGVRGMAVLARVAAALRLAAAVQRTATLLGDGEHAQAERAAGRALRAPTCGARRPHNKLRAVLLYHKALAAAAQGKATSARHGATAALAEDGQLIAARRWLSRLDGRLARPRERAVQLQLLASLPGRPEDAAAAAHALRTSLRRRARPPRQLLAHGRTLLRGGDAQAARRWVERARQQGAPGEEALALLAQAHRALQSPRRAFETGLLQFATHGYSPELILALHDDSAALDNSPGGLRWLARYRDRLGLTHAGELHRRVNSATVRTGERLARRVLRSTTDRALPAVPPR